MSRKLVAQRVDDVEGDDGTFLSNRQKRNAVAFGSCRRRPKSLAREFRNDPSNGLVALTRDGPRGCQNIVVDGKGCANYSAPLMHLTSCIKSGGYVTIVS